MGDFFASVICHKFRKDYPQGRICETIGDLCKELLISDLPILFLPNFPETDNTIDQNILLLLKQLTDEKKTVTTIVSLSYDINFPRNYLDIYDVILATDLPYLSKINVDKFNKCVNQILDTWNNRDIPDIPPHFIYAIRDFESEKGCILPITTIVSDKRDFSTDFQYCQTLE